MRFSSKSSQPIVVLFALAAVVPSGRRPVVEKQTIRSSASLPADTTGCLDSLVARDSLAAVLKMSVLPQNYASKLPHDFADLFVDEFRARFKPPRNLDLSVVVGAAPCDSVRRICEGGKPMLMTVAYATARSNGTLTQLRLIDASLTRVFADSIMSALSVINKEKMVPFFVSPDTIPIEIWFELEANPDSIARGRQLFRATLPKYTGPFQPPDWPRNSQPPKYPTKAERAGVGDTVLVNFTITADGRVAPQSVDVTRGHYRDFIKATIDVLGKTVFRPARTGRCPVATWVRQTFIFSFQGPRLIIWP